MHIASRGEAERGGAEAANKSYCQLHKAWRGQAAHLSSQAPLVVHADPHDVVVQQLAADVVVV
jgi:hypothetical protein